MFRRQAISFLRKDLGLAIRSSDHGRRQRRWRPAEFRRDGSSAASAEGPGGTSGPWLTCRWLGIVLGRPDKARWSRRSTAALGHGGGALVKQGEDGRAWGLQGTERKVAALALWIEMGWRGGFHVRPASGGAKGAGGLV